MLIECSIGDRDNDAVESGAVTHIRLTMNALKYVEALLSEDVIVSHERGMFVENYINGNNALTGITNTDEIQKLFDDCGGADVVAKIILTKEHPMFYTIIKMVEANQVLS